MKRLTLLVGLCLTLCLPLVAQQNNNGGMNSIPEEDRLDVKGLLTVEEFATLWEIDNYERFREYSKYRTPCSSIVDDIIAKADARLQAGERGADLRFGSLETVSGPYYRWEDLRDFLQSRVSIFVTR